MKNDIAQGVPPVAVAGWSFFIFSLQEWVYVLTLVYLMFQIILIAHRTYKTFKRKRNIEKRRHDDAGN